MVPLPESYKFIQDNLEEMTNHSTDLSILDIGCTPGHYLEYLMAKGYDAYGIDLDMKFTEYSGNRERLKEGDSRDLKEIFADKKFDAITAQSALCVEAQIEAIVGPSWPLLPFVPEAYEIAMKAIKDTTKQIIASCFEQLKPGGLFIASEDYYTRRGFEFTEKDARDIGYEIISYAKNKAVMRKPTPSQRNT
jgi:SAM-dependent methyltransferase